MEEVKGLGIVNVIPFDNEKYKGIKIQWSANIGFGEYEVFFNKETETWGIDSECMDSVDDHEFGQMLFSTMLNSIKDVR